MYLEESQGDLKGAIALYEKVVKDNNANRAIAAKALLRLGGCYEKLGRDEAINTYETLLRDYPDQPEQTREAQNRLAAMAKPAG